MTHPQAVVVNKYKPMAIAVGLRVGARSRFQIMRGLAQLSQRPLASARGSYWEEERVRHTSP